MLVPTFYLMDIRQIEICGTSTAKKMKGEETEGDQVIERRPDQYAEHQRKAECARTVFITDG